MSDQYIHEQDAEYGKQNIVQYLRKGEGQKIEFKQEISSLEKIAKTICAFANTEGGILLVGIQDDKLICGVDSEQEKYILNEATQFNCAPPIPLSITSVYVDAEVPPKEEVCVLFVQINESGDKPHKAKNEDGEWEVYHRHNDQTLIAGAKAERLMEVTDEESEKKPKLHKNQIRLLDHLQKESQITHHEYATLVNISLRRARRELNENLNLGLIRVLEHEEKEIYVL